MNSTEKAGAGKDHLLALEASVLFLHNLLLFLVNFEVAKSSGIIFCREGKISYFILFEWWMIWAAST